MSPGSRSDSAELDALFRSIREASTAGAWSRGVELARADAVVGERAGPDEWVLRVGTQGGLISPAVTLYPEDRDWECECPSGDTACEHVAAAVIALRRAREAGEDLPGAASPAGLLRYRFTREHGGLALERCVARGEREVPLRSTLSAVTSGRVDGPRLTASQQDLAVEHALGSDLRGLVPRHRMAALLRALAGSAHVSLDGVPVTVSAEPVLPVVRVEDRGDGFAISLTPDPRLSDEFANGAALCGDALRPLGEARLTLREREQLAGGRYYPPERCVELVGELLPSLERRVPVQVLTRRLPETEREPPRLRVEVAREGDRLAVLPTLVYGDPPRARVDGERLFHLGGKLPLRDPAAERRLVRALQQELELLPGRRVQLAGAEAVELAERLRGWSGSVVGDAHRDFHLAPPLLPELRVRGDGFELRFESASGGRGAARSADPARVLEAWSRGESLVPLVGGGFAPLPAGWLERFGQRVADLLAARREGGALPAAALPDLARLCDDLEQPRPPGLARLAPLLDDFTAIPETEPPPDLRGSLRAYQRRGVDWLCFLRDAGLGGLLADDMGLGKTVQALCALRGRTLVVSPTSVLENWAAEVERFRPALHAALYHGPRRALDPHADVTLTTYAILRLDADALAAERWDTLVLDEAQAIKNPDSQVARAAYRLDAGFRIALTGTPVENRLDELWSQLHFANRGLLGGRSDFERRYARPIRDGTGDAAARLRERIRPFVLRRLKRDVAPELPPRTEGVLRCELSEEERAVYDAVRAATRDQVVASLERGGSVLAALEVLLRLRQAACHPALVPGQRADVSSKLELLLETLDSVLADGHRALVFSQWTGLLDLVEPHLRRADFPFDRLDGSTRDRASVVERFQSESGAPILLISLRAGGTGLNLTAADHVFLLDPWWNPAVEDQAADRTHRIGQERPVFVHRLVARDTVEERILALQERKRALADAALAGADAAGGLTRDDLLGLLA